MFTLLTSSPHYFLFLFLMLGTQVNAPGLLDTRRCAQCRSSAGGTSAAHRSAPCAAAALSVQGWARTAVCPVWSQQGFLLRVFLLWLQLPPNSKGCQGPSRQHWCPGRAEPCWVLQPAGLLVWPEPPAPGSSLFSHQHVLPARLPQRRRCQLPLAHVPISARPWEMLPR